MRAIIIIIIGFTAGMLSGLLGIGGGIILVPAMVYLLGMSQHRAHGTSLAVISLIALASSILYGKSGNVDWTIAIVLAVGGVMGALVGARLCSRTGAPQLRKFFGLLMAVVAVSMLFDAADALFAGGRFQLPALALPTIGFWGILLVLGIGVATGILSGLLGVGGGVIMIPAMILLLGLSQKLAQGISLAVIVPVSISGTLIHFKQGNIRFDVWKWLTIGGVLGGVVGVHVAIGLDDMILRGIFGILFLVVAILTLRGGSSD